MPAGRLSRDQLLAQWVASVDPDHARGVLSDPDSAAAIEQACEQLSIVSTAIEESSQELYLLHGSGQSRSPAGGAARSSVALTLTRTLRLGELLVLEPNALVEEVAIDATKSGAIEVRTGRRYALLDRVTFFPGDAGPLQEDAIAERPGRGYDHPLPGSIRGLLQPAGGLFNDEASLTPGLASPHALTAAPKPDAPVPDHVGQNVVLTQGANAGQRRRSIAYIAPTAPIDAGGLLLRRDALLAISITAGAFEVGERVRGNGGRVGILLAISTRYALVEVFRFISFVGITSLLGDVSAATATVTAVEFSEVMTAESATAAWRIEDPITDFGLSITNSLSPSGGRDATLDSIAWERGTTRAPGEEDELLRERIADPSDAVSPMAVLRSANRALVPFAAEAQLFEAGREGLPGIYADVDAFDLDGVAITPQLTGFIAGEIIHQESSGASGTAITQSPAGLGILGPLVLVGIARVHGTFEAGQPIFGERSGSSVPLPVFSGSLRPEDRFRVAFSYAEMRGFFLIASSHQGIGDFGIAFDEHPFGFFDSSPALSFHDGFAATSAATSQRVWQSVDEVRPAGVGFTLVAPSGQST